MNRNSKLTTLDDVIAQIVPGTHLSFGGVLSNRRPALFVRELARRRIGDLTLSGLPGAGWDVDLLIGMGLVRKILFGIVTLAPIGMAPSFRLAVENGTVEAPIVEAMSLAAAFLAGGYRHPYHFIQTIDGTDFPEHSGMHETLTDSQGIRHCAVRAIRPDFSVLHVEEADEYGNARHAHGPLGDALIARAADRTIVFAERIVANSEIRAESHRTTIPAHLVTAVVEAPFGAHPTGTSLYRSDMGHLRAYHSAAEQRRLGDATAFYDYVRRFIDATTTWDQYYAAVGGEALERQLTIRGIDE
jgi:glutaconate CoA-transferase subunit A